MRLIARSPDDEIYRVSCKRDIAACRGEAARVCGGRYDVLESTGGPIEPERVSSAPGPSSTGPRYQRAKWVGQMVVACGEGHPDPEDVASARSPLPSAPTTSAAQLEPERLCIPGVTQECLGPAACRGAQACLPDGNGYGPCDCGHLGTSTSGLLDAGTQRR